MNREKKEERKIHTLLKQKIAKTFEKLKNIKLNKKSDSLWFDDSDKVRLCIMTSRSYPSSHTQKYWFTLTESEKDFLDDSQKGYVFLGFLDNNQSAYLIPFFDYKECFLNCDITDTGWHIRINHQLKWYFSKNEYQDIDLLKFEVSLTVVEEVNTELNLINRKQSLAKEKCKQRLHELKNALQSFEEAHSFYLKNPDHNIYAMALIQGFEFSFELSWVALKYFIQYKEVSQFKYARDIIKQAFNKDIIKDGSMWLDMLEDRNNLSHVYNENMAKKIIENISKKYIVEIKNLYNYLTKEL